MSTHFKRIQRLFLHWFGETALSETEQLAQRLKAIPSTTYQGLRCSSRVTPQAIQRRWDRLCKRSGHSDIQRILWQEPKVQNAPPDTAYQANIENYIGTVQVPVGLAGPLRIQGLHAQGDYYLPLATTEAALVASYNRGAQAIGLAGGCQAALLNEGIQRSPGFVFNNLGEVGLFVSWILTQEASMKAVAESTTRHGQLQDIAFAVEGNHVYLTLDFLTGDAAGQNMVTIASEAVCHYLINHSPVPPKRHYVEANFSGDKKASALAFTGVRGKKVTAEVLLPAAIVEKVLQTTPQAMADYWQMSALGSVQSGALGAQGHYANGLAALFIATGQDVACVAEAAVGLTRMSLDENGHLYTAVTLPSLAVGTVGGGTHLPTQQACLQILGLAGPGNARALAEVCAGMALAGELSIIAALAAGHFTQAHQRLARQRKTP
ncbi:MAG: hydroxymethylglutaryl-CoA reductase [Candidatus Melainabacteria bacterium]|nr:hydroxymethylglutaryl-CoA reductase [Candidatus Melainabacteria bacterium]